MKTTIQRLSFDFRLNQCQTPAFRGAIIKAMGDKAHPLMHNHIEEGLRYAYPLVQYKVFNKRPCIICIGEVGKDIRQILTEEENLTLDILGMKRKCKVIEIEEREFTPRIDDQPKYYSLTSYLPLTGDNVKEYDSLMALTDKICMIEKILTGNILSFFKGIGYSAEKQIVCVVTSIDKKYDVGYKHVHFHAFDLHFVSNVQLPAYIGLGKSSSIGMGILQEHPLPEKYIIPDKA